MHIQGCWTLACVLCWVIVEAKCLITCDRQSSGGPRRNGLQNNTQLSSDLHLYYHPKHGKDLFYFFFTGGICQKHSARVSMSSEGKGQVWNRKLAEGRKLEAPVQVSDIR